MEHQANTTLPDRITEEEKTCLYKPGSIRRIKLRNFLTYADVEFSPGPRLNVVIGPNGTGKSTILCAICLGLGGQPPLLGRADDVRIFIMRGRDKSDIEIELVPHHDISNSRKHVIKRVIDRNKGAATGRGGGSSLYYINGDLVSVKAVQKLVKDTYHIAIDNLCTFLPQDRVGSFSGFDARMLLRETQKSLSRSQHLYNEHENLIKLEEQLLSSDSNIQSFQDKLKRLQAEHNKLERVKELMEKRQKHLDEIKLLTQKLRWVEFDNTRETALGLKDQKKVLKEHLKAAQICLRPLKDRMGHINNSIKVSVTRSQEYEGELLKARKEYDTSLRKAELCQDEVDSASNEVREIDTRQRRAEGQVESCRIKVEEMEALLGDYPPEDELKDKKSIVSHQMSETKKQMGQAKREAERKQMEYKDRQNEKEQLVKKFHKMLDDKARRNERIYARDAKLHETYKWIDQNRKMFRHQVWGPIVCEIATKTNNTAAFLEQHVSNGVLKSFVVESKDDYDLLFREAREKRGLSINIQIVDHGKLERTKRNYSESRMELLKREHGVYGYLDESFEAPDAILQALRNTSNVHSVLVGSSRTYESLDRANLLDFLSKHEDGRPGLRATCIFASHRDKSFKYTSIISRYSGKASIRVDEINPARLLSPGVSPEAKNNVEKQIGDIELEIQNLEPGMNEAGVEYESLQKKGQECSYMYKDAAKALEELGHTKRKVALAKRKLQDAVHEASKDNVNEKRQLIEKLKKNVSKYVSFLEDAYENFDFWIKSESILTGIRVSEDDLHAQERRLRDQLTEKESQSIMLQEDYHRVAQEFDRLKSKLGKLKDEACHYAPITDANGNDLPLKAELDQLPADENELHEAIDHATENAEKIRENPEALLHYEEQKREIEELTQQMERLNESKDAKTFEITSKRGPWEASLTKIVDKVNAKFALYMKDLDCAGEIKIAKGEASEHNFGNFKEWGIQIRVKFRAQADLQVLSAQVHSGGERSVSTIMYLMAMQDLMVSPFRCVDEINQGLDERNERLVFSRIVENSTIPPVDESSLFNHCGQYFLITPKLLPNLTQMENEDVTILFVFNGVYSFNHHRDWNANNFLQWRKRKPLNDDHDDNDSSNTTSRTKKRKIIT